MIKNEKVYLGFSILMALAAISLFLPEDIFYLFWGKSHDGPTIFHYGPNIFHLAVLSLILAIVGIFKVFKAKREKRGSVKVLALATFLAFSFFLGIFIRFKIFPNMYS